MSLTDQQWCPTSVQVTALQARGLRVKGKSGTNDAYAVLQVGKEKFQTSVVEKSVTPVWKEEATFDLPQLLRGGGGGGSERSTLQVQVLHRALVGPDKLLGQAVINLPQLSEDTTRNKTECDPALVSENSHIVSSDEMDPIRSQREKRKAPPPPESGQDGRQMQKAQDVAELQMNKQNLDSDGKTVNFVSQCSTTIPPQNKSLTDLKNTQSSTPTSELNDKRPAPSRPQPVAKDSSELKKIKSARNIPHMGSTAKEQVLPIPCSNPFENENELSDQKDSSASGPVCWPPASTQKADRDAASQVKLKSSKMAPAPVPPAKKDANGGEKIINKGLKDANDQQESTGHLHVNNGPNSDSQRIKTSEKPPSSRRLLPVKPLNPSDQPFTSLFQEDAKSPGIGCELQTKNKVPDTVMTGPFSQLTREELVCLVLKQETHLLEKQSKISELEQYIDNLLVRVIEEQPSILMSLSAAPKKVA
uniref:RAB11 family interacting protein 1 (class I) b n=1 Tax=Oryzias latipes TaxID=8090 RepID=A0A3P9H5C6_ORYLA